LNQDLRKLVETVKNLKESFFARIEKWPIVLTFKDKYAANDNAEQIIITI